MMNWGGPSRLGMVSAFFVTLTAWSAQAQLMVTRETRDASLHAVDGAISRADCDTNALALALTGLDPGAVASVWVTTDDEADCAQRDARLGGICVDTGLVFAGSGGPVTEATFPFRELTEALVNVESCRDVSSPPAPAEGLPFRVFLLVDVSANDTDEAVVLSSIDRLDLVGPTPPPAITTVAAEEDGVTISFDGALPEDAQGLRVFAEPTEREAPCASPNLIPGAVAAAALAVAQRSMPDLAPLRVTLPDELTYALGGAAVDDLGNTGPLSELSCGRSLGFTPLSGGSGGCVMVAVPSDAPTDPGRFAPCALIAFVGVGLARALRRTGRRGRGRRRERSSSGSGRIPAVGQGRG
ncbi:MAG: hypothetical protein AAF928_14990 [Myxococcota bacterium]